MKRSEMEETIREMRANVEVYEMGMLEAAKATYCNYRAYVSAGFTEAQAFGLVQTALAAAQSGNAQ
ncbi:MAG TPA: hypothetical protein VMV98_08100 [Acidobacteriaceae bacterium]|nr:hypothetical protein [Acidobacteriaceae bacterium]